MRRMAAVVAASLSVFASASAVLSVNAGAQPANDSLSVERSIEGYEIVYAVPGASSIQTVQDVADALEGGLLPLRLKQLDVVIEGNDIVVRVKNQHASTAARRAISRLSQTLPSPVEQLSTQSFSGYTYSTPESFAAEGIAVRTEVDSIDDEQLKDFARELRANARSLGGSFVLVVRLGSDSIALHVLGGDSESVQSLLTSELAGPPVNQRDPREISIAVVRPANALSDADDSGASGGADTANPKGSSTECPLGVGRDEVNRAAKLSSKDIRVLKFTAGGEALYGAPLQGKSVQCNFVVSGGSDGDYTSSIDRSIVVLVAKLKNGVVFDFDLVEPAFADDAEFSREDLRAAGFPDRISAFAFELTGPYSEQLMIADGGSKRLLVVTNATTREIAPERIARVARVVTKSLNFQWHRVA